VTDERAVTKGEVLAMRLASAAGIDAAPARLVDSDGAAVALIRRFDRPAEGGRFLYASAATLLGAGPDDSEEHSYTEIVDALRVHGAQAQTDIVELWRRIAFSVAINNVDDHLHNHGFLHVERGRWRLAPAFDLNPFPDRAREFKTWISADSGPQASLEALRAIAPYFRIRIRQADEILGEVERAVATWRDVGRSLGMSKGELGEFASAFEHNERLR
jgi:serine/threonine-protein kinase HipA